VYRAWQCHRVGDHRAVGGQWQVAHLRQLPDKRGQVPDIAVMGYGVQWIAWSEAHPKRPLAATVMPIGGHATRSRRVLVP
jgi:hypothetical protein